MQQPVVSPPADAELAQQALAVLEANRIGEVTRPSPLLYPHQWSWDSAFIAIGYARHDQERAQRELRVLFAAQWRNGLLPHIVFAEGDGRYFPGPDFWQVERSLHAPLGAKTSGIVQPPIHATAAWQVHRHASDRRSALVFLEALLPRLAAWHGYLYRERTRGDDGLVEIWHPWESGMDNSPLWDDALGRIMFEPGDVPAYRRVDVEYGAVSERPTDHDYDRYAYLVKLFRDHRYQPEPIREACPFAVRDVLFNAILVQSNRDLAAIARVLGEDAAPFEAWADRTAAGLDGLWDAQHATYADHDVRAGGPVATRTAAGLTPLYAGVPSPARARLMVEGLLGSAVRTGDRGFVAPSLPVDDPRFQPNLYWRGPVWPVLNWLLYHGLVRYGYRAEAQQIRDALIDLPRHGGFFEHYDPTTGRGHGGEQCAWTAALTLDLLGEQDAGNPT